MDESTKVMERGIAGCLVQVSAQQGNHVAEAMTFIPGAYLTRDCSGQPALSTTIPRLAVLTDSKHPFTVNGKSLVDGCPRKSDTDNDCPPTYR